MSCMFKIKGDPEGGQFSLAAFGFLKGAPGLEL